MCDSTLGDLGRLMRARRCPAPGVYQPGLAATQEPFQPDVWVQATMASTSSSSSWLTRNVW